MDTRGEYRFSSLMKQTEKGENCAVFCFAGKRIFFLYLWCDCEATFLYTLHYSPINRSEIITDPLKYDPPYNPSRHQLYRKPQLSPIHMPKHTVSLWTPVLFICSNRTHWAAAPVHRRGSLSRSPSSSSPSFTQSPSPPRSLVRDGQISPHRPWLVDSHSTCPLLSPSPHANNFVIRTAVVKTHTLSRTQPPEA
jgi:hypothetical protein